MINPHDNSNAHPQPDERKSLPSNAAGRDEIQSPPSAIERASGILSIMPARRIASLLASGTEILDGLGLLDRVVAVSHECDFPEAVKCMPRVTCANIDDHASSREIDDTVRQWTSGGRALYTIDVDRLAEVKPDVIVTQSQCDVCAVSYDDVLSAVRSRPELARTRIVDLNPHTLDGIYQDVVRVAEATGVPHAGRAYVQSLKKRADTVQKRTAQLEPGARPRVVGIEWIDPPMVAGNWMPELIHLAGGRCDLAGHGMHSAYTAWKKITDYDPQIMLIMPCGFELQRALAEASTLDRYPGWPDMSAVRDRRVYAVDGNAYFNRSGPRIIDSLELLAHLIQPERFPEFSGLTVMCSRL